jgi:hypothetical protein
MEDVQSRTQVPRRPLPDLLETEGLLMLQGLAVFPALFAAAIVRTDRRIVRTLRAADATSAASAIPLDVRFPLRRWRLERLVRQGGVQSAGSGRYYIDESAWREYRARRQRRAMTMMAILVPLTLLIIWLTSR